MVVARRPPRKDYARTVPDSVGVSIGDLHASCFWKVLGCCRASIAAITENPWTLWSKRVARLSPAAHGGSRSMASVSAAELLPLSLKPTDAAELTAQDVVVHFGGLAAIADVSLTVGRHEVFGLLGPNGAGKTTLVNCLTGFHAPSGCAGPSRAAPCRPAACSAR